MIFGVKPVSKQNMQPGATTPLMDGVAKPGSSDAYARSDHVHPTDTSLAPINSPVFSGYAVAPTQSLVNYDFIGNDTIVTTEWFENRLRAFDPNPS